MESRGGIRGEVKGNQEMESRGGINIAVREPADYPINLTLLKPIGHEPWPFSQLLPIIRLT